MSRIGRMIPESGSLHGCREVWTTGGVSRTLLATAYKHPENILVRIKPHEKQDKRDSSDTGQIRKQQPYI